MTCGIEEHQEGLARLDRCLGCSDVQCVAFTLVEVLHDAIEMHLLRDRAVWPHRWHVVLHALEADRWE